MQLLSVPVVKVPHLYLRSNRQTDRELSAETKPEGKGIRLKRRLELSILSCRVGEAIPRGAQLLSQQTVWRVVKRYGKMVGNRKQL